MLKPSSPLAFVVILMVFLTIMVSVQAEVDFKIVLPTNYTTAGQHFLTSFIPSETISEGFEFSISIFPEKAIGTSQLRGPDALATCTSNNSPVAVLTQYTDRVMLKMTSKVQADASIRCVLFLRTVYHHVVTFKSPLGSRSYLRIDQSAPSKPLITKAVEDPKTKQVLVSFDLYSLTPNSLLGLQFYYVFWNADESLSMSSTEYIDTILDYPNFNPIFDRGARVWYSKQGFVYDYQSQIFIATNDSPSPRVSFTLPLPPAHSLEKFNPLAHIGDYSVVFWIQGATKSAPYPVGTIPITYPISATISQPQYLRTFTYTVRSRAQQASPVFTMDWLGYDQSIIVSSTSQLTISINDGYEHNIELKSLSVVLNEVKKDDYFTLKGQFTLPEKVQYHYTVATFQLGDQQTTKVESIAPTDYNLNLVSATIPPSLKTGINLGL